MMKTKIKKCALVTAFVVAGICAAYAQSAVRDLANAAEAYTDRSREKREQEAAPDHVKEIFALAKKSAEEDGNINFCGFFVGMSHYDAIALCDYYEKKSGISGRLGVSFIYKSGKSVFSFKFTLKAVRSITRGGNTLDALAQAVANRVGDLNHYMLKDLYELKTIDGVILTLDKDGLVIQNKGVAAQVPLLATAEAAQKDKADAAEASARNERLKKRFDKIKKEPVLSIINDMVAIPGKDFKMGKFEVMQIQWRAVMGRYNPSHFEGDIIPVEGVSWDDCKEFLEKLNAMPEVKASELMFRLPTEAEWEYACRAGGTGDYCRLADGTEITEDTLSKVAWHKGNSGEKTHPVGLKEPNAYGLYDMYGNVWEWCEDLDKGSSIGRLNRGGGWSCDSMECNRRTAPHDMNHIRDLGFRLVAQTRDIRAENEALREAREAAAREEKEFVQEIIENMVAIPGKNFKIGKYEVTQKLWCTIMGDNPSWFKGENNPVNRVSWDDCQKFLEKLNAMQEVKSLGLVFRLPTEAEWEYACRGGEKEKQGFFSSGRKYDFCRLADGTTIRKKTLDKVAWYKKNSKETSNSFGQPHSVGMKMPNAFGLYDMHGNVWEWCVNNMDGDERRVMRGGDADSDASYCTADFRNFGFSTSRDFIGFRLAVSLK